MTRPTKTLLCVLLFAVLATSAAEAAEIRIPREGLYEQPRHARYPLGFAPSVLTTFELHSETSPDLLVGSARSGTVALVPMIGGRPGPISTRDIGPGSMALAPIEGFRTTELLTAGGGSASIFDFVGAGGARSRFVPKGSVELTGDPSEAVKKSVQIYGMDLGQGADGLAGGVTADFAVADRSRDSVRLVDRDWKNDPSDFSDKGHLKVLMELAVGDAPSGIAVGEYSTSPIFVANSGSGTVSELRGWVVKGKIDGETIPVGGEPVALAVGDFVGGDYGDPEVAVVDRARDEVLLLDSRRDDGDGDAYRVVGRYPVGREPVAIAKGRLDDLPGMDLAVADTGSDEVSILSGTGTGFAKAGAYPTGSEPIALGVVSYGRNFENEDLAIADRGSKDLSFLARRQFGSCEGRAARLRVGDGRDNRIGPSDGPDQTSAGSGDDTIWGGSGGDCLGGGLGEDTIEAGSGTDRVSPGPGEDRVHSGHDDDTIFAADGERDRIECGAGEDVVHADAADLTHDCERVLRMEGSARDG